VVGIEILDKGVEDHFSSSGKGKRRSCVRGRALGGALALEWYQSRNISFLFVVEKRIRHATKERKTVT
jgi:hypothetical protein